MARPKSTLIFALLFSAVSEAAPCEPVTSDGVTYRVSSSDWRVFELVAEKESTGKMRLPVGGPGARCIKLNVRPPYVIVEFSRGMSGTQVASETELLLIYRHSASGFEEAQRLVLREHEGTGANRKTIARVESYRIAQSKKGWELEYTLVKNRKPKRVLLSKSTQTE